MNWKQMLGIPGNGLGKHGQGERYSSLYGGI